MAYTVPQLISLFANCESTKGEAGPVKFEGSGAGPGFVGTLYSYGMPIARIAGKGRAYITTRRYSRTVTAHTDAVRKEFESRKGFIVTQDSF